MAEAVPATPALNPSAARTPSPDASPAKAPAAKVPSSSFAQRTTRKVLTNGIVVDVIENHAVPTVAIRGVAFAGETSAPAGRRALPALTAKMLQRGTTSRTKEQIGKLLDDVGATRSYTTNLTDTSINANGMARDLPVLLGVIADELQHPAFAAGELAKAKKELETDYLRADDGTGARALERLSQLVYSEGHPYFAPGKQKLLAGVTAATADELRAFHRARYTGAGLVLAIVGDVDAAKTIALVEKHLGAIPKGERISFASLPRTTAGAKPVREAVTMPGKANMNLVIGTASGLRRNDPDYEAALIANAALGQNSLSSRIGRRVRDTEGLSYNLYSRYGNTDEVDGIWFVNVNVAPQNLVKAMKSTREEIDRFALEGVTDEEVAAQKSFFAGNYQVGLGSNAGIASALVTAEKYGFGPRYLDEFPARIRAVTREQVNEASKKHFFADRLNTIVAGDIQTVPD